MEDGHKPSYRTLALTHDGNTNYTEREPVVTATVRCEMCVAAEPTGASAYTGWVASRCNQAECSTSVIEIHQAPPPSVDPASLLCPSTRHWLHVVSIRGRE